MAAERVVAFDAARRGTRLEDWCDVPTFLGVSDPLLPALVFRTSVEFACGNKQHPLTIVGPGPGDRIRTLSLAGLTLSPAGRDASE